jgi:hypothetical protein
MTTDTAHTQTIETINGVSVTIYGGTARPILAYALPGHVTGWMKRNGARTTYAELTCTCHLTAELHRPEGEGRWTSYGEGDWIGELNRQARAHVENVTANAFWIRPAKGDRTRKADRTRVNRQGLFEAMQRHGLRYSELQAHIADVIAGMVVTAEDGTRFEIARDRGPYCVDPLPIH